MAKKPKRRFNLRRVRLTPELDLSTLGSDTTVVQTIVGTAVSSYRCTSVKNTWNLVGLTAGEGPITVGIAHSDYTVTEIKECLEASGSIDPGDKIQQERANRLVRIVGVLDEVQSSLNEGKPLSTKLNWFIAVGDSINMWATNEGVAALTTGAQVKANGNAWVTP